MHLQRKSKRCAKDGFVLIDDGYKNIKAWEDNGGIGILHESAEGSCKVKKLEKETNMKYAYQINTQNVEEYGTNFYKYKGGCTYIVASM